MHVIPRCWYIGHSVPGSGSRRKQKEEARAAVAARGKDSMRGLPFGQGFCLQGKTLELGQEQLSPMNRFEHVSGLAM